VATLLPVTFEGGAAWEDVDKDVHPVLTPAGQHSMAMILETPPDRNDTIWARAKPLSRVPPLTGAKPGAIVLAELSDTGPRVSRYPLISWQRYGTGKSMLIATDRLWRLRFKTGDKYHWRLWSQTIQFLTLSRLLGEHKRIRLETDRSVYGEGEQVRVYANVLNDVYEPVTVPAYEIYIKLVEDEDADPVRVRLKPEYGISGLYQGYFAPGTKGRYRVRSNAADRPFANTTEFHVTGAHPELAATSMRESELKRIAELSGGKYCSIRDLPTLPDVIRGDREVITVRREYALWDTWIAAAAFVALAGFEWFYRRRNDLS
jgi:hypothetical protein